MASPFLEDPVELGARIVRGALRRARTFRDRQNPLSFPDDYLYERYRFSPHVANACCALTIPQTVCLALRYFATGTFMYSVGDAENLSKNTVYRTIRKVVRALTAHLNAFVVFPGHLPTQTIKKGFYEIAGFPRVIGAIDCTHIPISAPLGVNEGDFVNRKSSHSINVQVNHKEQATRLFSGLLVGDPGYACQPFLMTPYSDPNRATELAPDQACQIVTACVVLHNVATIRKERAPPVSQQPPDVVDPITIDYPTGRAMREAITEQFFV
uniref:Harbinger transposase-derived nuclease n=1 Tax=Sander lucioperca TaxID=283035 RepID=A0A8C9Z0P6_SANLU